MNKFDRILWRINGILFLLILIFGTYGIVRSFSQPFPRAPSHQNGPAIVNEAQGTNEKELLHLEWPSRIAGTSILRMALRSEPLSKESSSFSSFKGGADRPQTRNFLFIDHSDLSSWWLFEAFDYAILKEHDLRADIEGKDKRVIGPVFEVATADTNGDHRVTNEDRLAAFFTAADGRKPVQIVSPSDRIISVDQVTNTQVLIVYQRGPTVTAGLFSTQDGAKIKESPIPIKK
jgi:hypothetical protein